MDRKELLTRVKEEAGLQSIKQADGAVRVIVGILKTILSPNLAVEVERSLPEDLRAGWRMVEAYPADILEREDLYYEGFEIEGESEIPTITHG
jgi:uncharacterized protein (DUF2267 family)